MAELLMAFVVGIICAYGCKRAWVDYDIGHLFPTMFFSIAACLVIMIILDTLGGFQEINYTGTITAKQIKNVTFEETKEVQIEFKYSPFYMTRVKYYISSGKDKIEL